MTTVSSDARLPLQQRLREYLAGGIAAQHWKAGDPIPSEAEFSVTHGISVAIVRKSVDCLVAEGLLDCQQRRGICAKSSYGGTERSQLPRITKRE
jgi:GntR family transcriptional regulator